MQRITLVTIGRRTGQPRPVSLYAIQDGSVLVVIGSKGGSAKDPAWAENLRAHPEATVRAGRREWPVRARETAGAERERLWRLACDAFPMYASFQRRTSRVIPVFVLDSAAEWSS